MLRIGEYLLGRPILHDATEIHYRNSICEIARSGQIVRNKQVTNAELLLDIFEQVHDLGSDRHIKRRHRLVKDYELGIGNKRGGNGNALP